MDFTKSLILPKNPKKFPMSAPIKSLSIQQLEQHPLWILKNEIKALVTEHEAVGRDLKHQFKAIAELSVDSLIGSISARKVFPESDPVEKFFWNNAFRNKAKLHDIATRLVQKTTEATMELSKCLKRPTHTIWEDANLQGSMDPSFLDLSLSGFAGVLAFKIDKDFEGVD